MNMTHYMELLATNQPWNLILFMAIPVILAETVAITELFLLVNPGYKWWIKNLNKIAWIIGGFYFLWVFFYLLKTAVFPLNATNGWRWPADIIAVWCYLLGVIPLMGIALINLGVLKSKGENWIKKLHAFFIWVFLVVAHIAMILWMLDPTIWGYKAAVNQTNMSSMSWHDMNNMNMPGM